jgi:carboxyl-terminal processing protease
MHGRPTVNDLGTKPKYKSIRLSRRRRSRCAGPALMLTAALVAGCGGGGGDGSAPSPAPAPLTIPWTPGIFRPSSSFAAQCLIPRTGTNPATGVPYPDVQGTMLSENHWLRSWSDELYLWYAEIADQDPSAFLTPDYFNVLRTFATTPSGASKDRFHFTYRTSEWLALSQSGVAAGYGAEWVLVSAQPPRQVVVAYTQPNSPAAAVNLARGAKVLAVDGVNIDATSSSQVNTINNGLFPRDGGQDHVFLIQDRDSATPRTVTMRSANITLTPIQHVRTVPTATGPVGYLSFTDHIATAEIGLIDAISALRAAAVTDLVLDLRYNGGGFLDIASELAYMIAGGARTGGRTFESIQFSDKHPSTNPITRTPLTPVPFYSTARGFSAAPGQALPTLDLPRVYVLTGAGTCSASESVINSLRGIDVEVIQVGAPTCGKPYGFYPADNCGTTYFSIQFKGVNARGFGDYSDGFAPSNSVGATTTPVPGCSVADDFTRALGDPQEGRLAGALGHRAGQGCPSPSGVISPYLSKPTLGAFEAEGVVQKSPWLMNKTLSDP